VTKDYPNVKLLAAQTGNFQRLNALQVMENLMQSFPRIDAVMAANDAMAIGAIEAVKSGKLLASGQADPFMQGCLGTILAIRNLRKQSTPPEMHLKPSVIDASNYKEFDMPVDARTYPKWDDVAASR
jgi:ribose transport system substrate-binding protein